MVQVSSAGFQSLLDLAGAQIGQQESNSDNWNQAHQIKERRERSWTSMKMKPTSADDLSEIRDLIRLYITHLLGYPPKLYSFMKQL